MYAKQDTTVREDHQAQQKSSAQRDSNALQEARSILNVNQFVTLCPINPNAKNARKALRVSMQIRTQTAKESQSKKRVPMECTAPAGVRSQIHQEDRTSVLSESTDQVKAQQRTLIVNFVQKAHTVMYQDKMQTIYRNAEEEATVQREVTLKLLKLVHQEAPAIME